MSALDPLAALAAQRAAILTAIADAALSLGDVAELLQTQLSVGDVLAATILPPKGGADLLLILGQQVVAQLPPGVDPGETLLLQVTGFSGNQILVRNLGVQDPQNPVPTFVPEVALPEGAPVTATLSTLLPPAPNVAAPNTTPPALPETDAASPSPPAAPEAPPVAPPREVFVAASVRPSNAPPAPAARPTPEPVAIEARLAANRAASVEARGAAPVAPSRPATPAAQAVPPQAAARAPSAPAARVSQPPPSPPAAAQASAAAVRSALREAVFTRPISIPSAPDASAGKTPAASTAAPNAPAAQNVPPQIAVRVALAANDPGKLLAALRIPSSPLTLAAARIVGDATSQVTAALRNLQTVLAQSPPADPRVATLQTLTTFLSNLNPANEQAFTAQLSSFIANVFEGAEAKIAAIVRALIEASPPPAPPGQTPAPAPPPHASPSDTPVAIAAQARVAERQAALSADLKEAVVSLVQNPPVQRSPQLTQALTDTLTALTAAQLNVAANNVIDPRALTLSLPVYFFDEGRASQVRITRDAGKGKERLDADNFHIAFVLDTKTLGTVAIDLDTVGRSVKVDVKTDRSSAVERFTDSFPDLRARLELLRYRIASMAADVQRAPEPAAVAPPAAPVKRDTNVDLRA
ncbi:MAG: hypothetical protein JOZ38_10910 [Candidatus Eremiobacteraeota bacterium]|nr:hypothetical protein [Candidatus Eremiobacteraeota bacterium]